jgi:RecB family exonuclease
VEVPLSDSSIFICGRIDRLDVEGQRTLVRDLKTGRARLRTEKDPDLSLDLQVAVYGLVARTLAVEWGVPDRIAVAYAYLGGGRPAERSYRDDFHETLEPRARGWLAVARDLLERRQFPRTPKKEDCTNCRFRPVCGDGVHERPGSLLPAAGGALADFAALKGAGIVAAEVD